MSGVIHVFLAFILCVVLVQSFRKSGFSVGRSPSTTTPTTTITTALYGRRPGGGKFRKAIARELGNDGEPNLSGNPGTATDIRYCYFDKRVPCPCEGRCKIDDRPCAVR